MKPWEELTMAMNSIAMEADANDEITLVIRCKNPKNAYAIRSHYLHAIHSTGNFVRDPLYKGQKMNGITLKIDSGVYDGD